MNPAVEKFGNMVDDQLAQNPAAARKLLTTAFRLNGWAGKHVFKKVSPAHLALDDVCNQMILRSFEDRKSTRLNSSH